MDRLTNKNVMDEIKNRKYGGVPWAISVWVRLCQIENILGDTYDLDRLRELVGADQESGCEKEGLELVNRDLEERIEALKAKCDRIYRDFEAVSVERDRLKDGVDELGHKWRKREKDLMDTIVFLESQVKNGSPGDGDYYMGQAVAYESVLRKIGLID